MRYDEVLSRLSSVRQNGGGHQALCPAHDDREPSLSITQDNGKVLLYCHAGCSTKDIVAALGIRMGDLSQGRPQSRSARAHSIGVTLAELAAAKGLPLLLLRDLGWHDVEYDGRQAVAIPFLDQLGRPLRTQIRTGLRKEDGGRFKWAPGSGTWPLGLDRLEKAECAGKLLIVEGATDYAACVSEEIPVFAVPGSGTWKPEWAAYLHGVSEVYVWCEPDKGGPTLVEKVGTSRSDVLVVHAPPEAKDPCELRQLDPEGFRKGMEHLMSGARPRELQTDELERRVTGRKNGKEPELGLSGLPEVELAARPLRDVSDQALRILKEKNEPPKLFVRGGALARVRADEDGRPIIDTVGEAELSGCLTRTMDFLKGGNQVYPPERLTRDIIALGEWLFPPLVGVAEVPVLRQDGSILKTPGYDPATRLFYRPDPGLDVPPIPESPSRTDVEAALAQVEDVIYDFPFLDPASRANAIGAMLTPEVRPAIDGRVPLGLISSPRQGSGKGLLAEEIATIATGRPAAMFSAPSDNEEWRKQITAALKDGSTVVIVDNVAETLDSASLARAITATVWADRILGRSEIAHLPQQATWFATGNNISVAGDLVRRSYWIKLDPRVPRPWLRTGFRHKNLLRYVCSRRGELLAALLTLARGWYVAGCPPPPTEVIMGSFQQWADVVGGILAYAGVEGFLANLSAMYEQMEEDTASWERFVEAWHLEVGEEPMRTKDLVSRLQGDARFGEALPESLAATLEKVEGTKGLTAFKIRLGLALKQRDGTLYDNGLRLQRETDDSHDKVGRWQVILAGSGAQLPADSVSAAGSGGESAPQPQRDGNIGENVHENHTGSGGPTPSHSPHLNLDPSGTWPNSPQSSEPCRCDQPEGQANLSGPACPTCERTWWCPGCGGCRRCRQS